MPSKKLLLCISEASQRPIFSARNHWLWYLNWWISSRQGLFSENHSSAAARLMGSRLTKRCCITFWLSYHSLVYGATREQSLQMKLEEVCSDLPQIGQEGAMISLLSAKRALLRYIISIELEQLLAIGVVEFIGKNLCCVALRNEDFTDIHSLKDALMDRV